MRALVIGGGGAKGAIALGVIDALRARGYDWDLYAGTSTGSIIAAMEAQGQHSLMKSIWLNIRGNGDIYKDGLLRKALGVLKGGLYDPSPLYKKLKAEVAWDKVRHPLQIATVSMATGNLVFGSSDTAPLADWVLASCSFPPAFPPVTINGIQYADGGVREIIPLKVAVKAGATEIDVVACSPIDMDPTRDKFKTLVSVGTRALAISMNEILSGDLAAEIERTRLINRLVAAGLEPDKREIAIRLWQPLNPGIIGTLDFNPDHVLEAYRHGRQVGEGAFS